MRPETSNRGVLTSSVGRKVLMAITGQLMIIFVLLHVAGNSTIYFGALNSYVEHLHQLPVLVWPARLVMLSVLLLHILLGVQLTLENRRAKGAGYSVNTHLRSTFSSRNMIWSGVVIAVFLAYHLLHFTFQVISPETAAVSNPDALGRPDVTGMVIAGLGNYMISIVYIFSLTCLLLHLAHGVQSSFQTLGLSSEQAQPAMIKGGYVTAFALFTAYVLIPALILIGMIKG